MYDYFRFVFNPCQRRGIQLHTELQNFLGFFKNHRILFLVILLIFLRTVKNISSKIQLRVQIILIQISVTSYSYPLIHRTVKLKEFYFQFQFPKFALFLNFFSLTMSSMKSKSNQIKIKIIKTT